MNHAYFGYRTAVPGLTFSAHADTCPTDEETRVEWVVQVNGYINGLTFDVDVFCLDYKDGLRQEIRDYLQREIRTHLDEYLRQNWDSIRQSLMTSMEQAHLLLTNTMDTPWEGLSGGAVR